MNISVIITTYNRSELAKRSLKSVTNQTYVPEELIIIEDASDSGIEDWIKTYHPEIIYKKNKKNIGLAGSRNVGIQLAKSDWIAFLDDDDEWMPNRLAEQAYCYSNLKAEEKEGLACIQVGVKKNDRSGKTTGIQLPVNDGNLKQSIKKFGASTPSSAFLFNKKALIAVDGFDETMVSGIDHDIWMKLAVAGYSTKALRKPLVIVRDEPISTMMVNTEKRIQGINQYIEKWTPTYIDWFGEKKGRKYSKEYFSMVIGSLGGQKLSSHQFKEFSKTLNAIWSVIGLDIKIWFSSLSKISKIYLVNRFGFINKIVQKREKLSLR